MVLLSAPATLRAVACDLRGQATPAATFVFSALTAPVATPASGTATFPVGFAVAAPSGAAGLCGVSAAAGVGAPSCLSASTCSAGSVAYGTTALLSESVPGGQTNVRFFFVACSPSAGQTSPVLTVQFDPVSAPAIAPQSGRAYQYPFTVTISRTPAYPGVCYTTAAGGPDPSCNGVGLSCGAGTYAAAPASVVIPSGAGAVTVRAVACSVQGTSSAVVSASYTQLLAPTLSLAAGSVLNVNKVVSFASADAPAGFCSSFGAGSTPTCASATSCSAGA